MGPICSLCFDTHLCLIYGLLYACGVRMLFLGSSKWWEIYRTYQSDGRMKTKRTKNTETKAREKMNQIQWNFREIPRKWMEQNFIVNRNVWRKIRMFLEMKMVIEWMILVLISNDGNGAIDSIWMVTSEMFSQNEWINDGMLCFC